MITTIDYLENLFMLGAQIMDIRRLTASDTQPYSDSGSSFKRSPGRNRRQL